MTLQEILRAGPVVPVIMIERVEQAVPLARALTEGGVRVLEVTLRTAAGLPAIREIAAKVPDAIVGAGTLTTPEQFREVKEAGAVFGVSPGLNPALVAAARDSGLPLLPGVMTPSEVINAHAAGFSYLKLFPARQAGGGGMLKALAGPFPEIKFCPTGGIDRENASEFLALPNVICVGGSWLVPAAALAANDWSTITRLAHDTLSLAR